MLKDYRGLLDAETQPLSEKDTRLFMSLTLTTGPMPDGMANALKDSLGYQIVTGQLNNYRVPASWQLRVWLSAISDRPGVCVMWAYTVALLAKDQPGEVTMEDWTLAFPWGVPTQFAIDKAWEAQKVYDGKGPDNWLDRSEQWPVQQPTAAEKPSAVDHRNT